METSIDEDDIKKKLEQSIFIELGHNPIFDTTSILKVLKSDKDEVLFALKKKRCKLVKILTTNNLNSTRLDDISVDDIGKSAYEMDDRFNKTYGPFKELETIDLTKLDINESWSTDNIQMKSTMTIEYLPGGGRSITT